MKGRAMDESQALLRRVASLERRCRTQQLTLVVLAFVASLTAIMGQGLNDSNNVIRAQRFEVIDESGAVAGFFECINGSGNIFLNGSNGKTRVILAALDAAGLVSVIDSTETEIASLSNAGNGGGMLRVLNQRSEPRVLIGARADGHGAIQIADRQARVVASIYGRTSSDGSTEGKMYVVSSEGGGGVILSGKNDAGTAQISLSGTHGSAVVSICEIDGAGSVACLDSIGQITGTLPQL
ncbi:MAG: hypothetical protein Kow0074_06680 [Candidatus Zixiibacteriota bacterium]